MQLSAQTREKLGKSVKTLRAEGLIPAELYGHGLENIHLMVDGKEFRKVFKTAGENTVIELLVGKDKLNALVHGIQKNHLTGVVDHIDFYQVRMDEVITTKIPVEFMGDAPAVKEQGGILNKTTIEIEVTALPAELPHSMQVDLSVLKEINQSIYVKDLSVPKGVKIEIDPDTVIVSVALPMAEEPIEQAPVDVSAVKVESEEKKAEREKEKADTAAK